MGEVMKTCACCGETKPMSTAFYRRTLSKDGYHPSCKKCHKIARDAKAPVRAKIRAALSTEVGATWKEIGDALGMTRQGAEQMGLRAMMKLQKALKKGGFDGRTDYFG
jgi:cytochrome c peroxidase